ncbi:hypothetical protein ACWCXH_00425 [Kitasatospora sp. NPDC001660]
MRADHDRIAGMRVAGIRAALPLLTPAGRRALFAPELCSVGAAIRFLCERTAH